MFFFKYIFLEIRSFMFIEDENALKMSYLLYLVFLVHPSRYLWALRAYVSMNSVTDTLPALILSKLLHRLYSRGSLVALMNKGSIDCQLHRCLG